MSTPAPQITPTIESVTAENNQLKAQLSQLQMNLKGMVAQLDATKQMFNEAMASCLQLRTNNNMMNGHINELNEKIKALEVQKTPPAPPALPTPPVSPK